jgi:hypothetical protein
MLNPLEIWTEISPKLIFFYSLYTTVVITTIFLKIFILKYVKFALFQELFLKEQMGRSIRLCLLQQYLKTG